MKPLASRAEFGKPVWELTKAMVSQPSLPATVREFAHTGDWLALPFRLRTLADITNLPNVRFAAKSCFRNSRTVRLRPQPNVNPKRGQAAPDS